MPLNSVCLLVYYSLMGIQLHALFLLKRNSGVIVAAVLFMLLVCKVISVTVQELELIAFASSGTQWIRDVRDHTVNVSTLLSCVFDSLFWVGNLSVLALISGGWMVISPTFRSRDPTMRWSAKAVARLLVLYTMMFLVSSLTRKTSSANMLDVRHTIFFGFFVAGVEAWIVWIVASRLTRRFRDESAGNSSSAAARESRLAVYLTCIILCMARILLKSPRCAQRSS